LYNVVGIDYNITFVQIINFRFSFNLEHSMNLPALWLKFSTTKLSKACR